MSNPKPQPPTEKPKFSYGKYFRTINLLADLQAPKAEQPWITHVPPEVEDREYVLYLGCNVLRTPALIQTVTDVLKRMKVDVAPVGGTANCCGIIHHNQGDKDVASGIGEKTIGALGSFKPKTVLMWCPSCNDRFQNTLAEQFEFGFEYIHVTKFLSDNAPLLPFTHELPLRVAVHHHSGLPQQELDGACTKKLLAAIPGVEIVELASSKEFGLQCLPHAQGEQYARRWRELAKRMLEEAREKRLDVMATVYHTCQREFCAEELNYPFKVEHYITLVGRALGIDHEDRYKAYTLLADEEEIFSRARQTIDANHLETGEVRELIREIFLR
jgi:Fe-S oxidoreductase